MEAEIFEEMRKRATKNFMDMLILMELKKGNPMSGYDVITFIHNKFRLLVSSGTVYSLLYAMERRGHIKGRYIRGKRVYTLTDQGKKYIETFYGADRTNFRLREKSYARLLIFRNLTPHTNFFHPVEPRDLR